MIRKTKWHKVSAKVIASALAAATGLSSFSGIAPGSIAFAETDGKEEATYETSASSEEVSDGASAASTATPWEESNESTDASTDASSDSAALDDSNETEEAGEKSEVEELAGELATSDSEESASDRNFDSSRTDVWDFGAEDLGSNYNNRS